MYERPSTSRTRAPLPDSTKNGSPPTDAKERTGEETPPGISCLSAPEERGRACVSFSGGAPRHAGIDPSFSHRAASFAW